MADIDQAAPVSDSTAAAASVDGPRLITVIMNCGAGADEKRSLRQTIIAALEQCNATATLVELEPHQNLATVSENLIREAKRCGGLVAAAGGDGTVNTIASLCCKHGVPMGVIPIGTFNYFARELGIPDDAAQAARVLASGRLRRVAVGYVNDHLFLNNASCGLYSRLIRRREEDKSRFGRFRIIAVLSAIFTLLRGQRPFAVKIHLDETQQIHRTAMVFVGNNTLQLANLNLDVASCTRADKLAVVILKPTKRLAMASLLLRGLMKSLNNDTHLSMFCTDSFVMETKRRAIETVVDGELVRCMSPLSFRVEQDALSVMVPAEVGQA